MAVRLSTLRTSRILLPRNIIILMFLGSKVRLVRKVDNYYSNVSGTHFC
jgi:hypothetical protein